MILLAEEPRQDDLCSEVLKRMRAGPACHCWDRLAVLQRTGVGCRGRCRPDQQQAGAADRGSVTGIDIEEGVRLFEFHALWRWALQILLHCTGFSNVYPSLW